MKLITPISLLCCACIVSGAPALKPRQELQESMQFGMAKHVMNEVKSTEWMRGFLQNNDRAYLHYQPSSKTMKFVHNDAIASIPLQGKSPFDLLVVKSNSWHEIDENRRYNTRELREKIQKKVNFPNEVVVGKELICSTFIDSDGQAYDICRPTPIKNRSIPKKHKILTEIPE